MKKIIPYGKHSITDEDIKSIIEVLKSDNITQGPKISEFEKKFATYVGSKYAIAVSSGTAALHLCALSLGIKKGDKIITTPNTFIASANCIRYCGGEVVFSDIDPTTFLLDIHKVRKLLESSPPGTYKGIIPVNFAGLPVNLEEFRSLADEFNLFIIEDSCHSPGGFFYDSKNRKQKSGNGNFANLSIFSFHPVKHIACGEGGMITTNNIELRDKILNLRTHGIQQNPKLLKSNHGPWYYEMQELGYNYRMTDFQAALGVGQMRRYSANLQNRKKNAKLYFDLLKNEDEILLNNFHDDCSYFLYQIILSDNVNRDQVLLYLKENGIGVSIHYANPVPLMSYYKNKYGYSKGNFINAEYYSNKNISLPVHAKLSNEDIKYICRVISAALRL